MTSRELWDRYRAWLIDLPGLGVRLDVSRMGLPADYLKSMEGPMLGAFDAMDALEAGEIANPDEERMVGHYWLRAPDLAPSEDIRNAILETGARVRRFAADIHAGALRPPERERFTHLLVVGIGGSALGPQFLADALGSRDDLLTPHFLDNTDPDGFDRVLGALGDGLAETLVVTISKSGGTAETRNGMLEVVSRFRAAGLDPGPCCVAITQDGSNLDAYAEEHGFLARFPMWDWVGGRTSIMSAVGVLPAALQGVDVDRLLDGAARMDQATRERRILKNTAALLALAWYHAGDGRGARDMVVLPYKDRLALFSRYLQQLVMESLGKERDVDGNVVHQGIAVYGNKGSTDQHAYVQQLRDGVPNFFASFIQVLQPRVGESLEVAPGVTAGDYLNGFLLGTRQALHESGRGSLTLTLDDVSPSRIGMLIALYERAVGLYASLVAVNAYNQPGVEAGKRAASGILELQRRIVAALALRGDRGATCAELAALVGAPDDEEDIFHILEHLAADPGRSIIRSGEGGTFDATYRARP